MRHFLVGALTLGILQASCAGSANAAIIANMSPDWQLIGGALGGTNGTWGLPADLNSIGCGAENETTCEPTGVWAFDTPFAGGPGYRFMTDPDQSVGDYLVYGNFGVGGNGEVRFYSDPNLNVNLAGLVNDGLLCAEGADGCIGTFSLAFAGGGLVTISAASDGENAFDPFGFHADTSDQIRFEGATIGTNVPEPGSLALIGAMLMSLLGLGVLRRRHQA